jgi:hypothetical protein
MRDTLRQRDYLRHFRLRTVFLRTTRGYWGINLNSSEGYAWQDVTSTLSQYVAFAEEQLLDKAVIHLLSAFKTEFGCLPIGRWVIVIVEEGLCMLS